MAAARSWTDTDDTQLRALHADGKTLHAIAGIMGRSKSTVSREAKRLGLPWDRANTAAATEAKVADARARRANLQLGLLEDAEKLRTQVWAPTMAFNFGGKDNTYNEHQLDQPTFADQLKIMQAVGIAVDRSLKLDLHDSGANTAAVVGLLQRTAAALGLTDHDDSAPPAE
jgi:hypothetical protein